MFTAAQYLTAIVLLSGVNVILVRSDDCQNLSEDSGDLTVQSCSAESTRVVTTGSGKLRGAIELSRNGSRYYAFLGIPFADPPKRFEVAKPVTPWTEIRSAVNYGPVCPQMNALYGSLGSVTGEEDCLHLNVYTPLEGRCKSDELLPVVFHIHGGAFILGSGELYHPKFFMDDCIVYVSTNYRLGALGFLTTGDEVLPGNLGMKDALLALKWTRDNIKYFNGNKDSITLNGVSAGAASVVHFMASPAARGLFHRVIAQSGSALAPWAVVKTPKENALHLGKLVGCNESSSLELKKCLSNVNMEDLVKDQRFDRDWLMVVVPFGPVVEPVDATEPFQTEDPYLRFKRGDIAQVPLMNGILKDEGIFIHGNEILGTPEVLDDLNANWHHAAPFLFMFSHLNMSEEKRNYISDKIREFYFGNNIIGSETKQAVYDSMSDLLFDYPVYEHSSLHSNHAPVYHYAITFQGNYSIIQIVFNTSERAVTHADDEPYLFKVYPFIPEPEPGSDRLRFSQKLVKLWLSFIKSGKPTEVWSYAKSWKPFTAQDPSTLKLDMHTENLIRFRQERMSFWDELKLRDLEFPGEQ